MEVHISQFGGVFIGVTITFRQNKCAYTICFNALMDVMYEYYGGIANMQVEEIVFTNVYVDLSYGGINTI